MSTPTGFVLSILLIAVVVFVYGLYFFRRLWGLPQQNRPGFFLGSRFRRVSYEGPGVRWLKGYRITVLSLYGVVAIALAAVILTGRWNVAPLWFVGMPFVIVIGMATFGAWARHKLGSNPPVLPVVAIPLEARRLRDYISWRIEALVAGIAGASWLLLLHSRDRVDWRSAATTTWLLLCMLLLKILIVRGSFPLPPERTEEHCRFSEANRRWSLRTAEVLRWAGSLTADALRHTWTPALDFTWLGWTSVAIETAPWIVFVAVILRGEARLAAMGRDLRPAGSWSTPFRSGRSMLPGGLTWLAICSAGWVLLWILFRH